MLKRQCFRAIHVVLFVLISSILLSNDGLTEGQRDSFEYTPETARRFEGLIVSDPGDTLNLTGGIVFAEVRSLETTSCAKRALQGLIESLRKYTKIQTIYQSPRNINSSRIMRMPFLYFHPAQAFELEPDEIENLAKYLYSGGFVFADKCVVADRFGPAEESLRKMFRDALGKQARFRILPMNHPIYHSFFHFEKGPPSSRKSLTVLITKVPGGFDRFSYLMGIPRLEGLYLGDRLVGIFSDKDYGTRWQDPLTGTSEVKFAVNVIAYILNHEGGIARWNSDTWQLEKVVEECSSTIAELDSLIIIESADKNKIEELKSQKDEYVELEQQFNKISVELHSLNRKIRNLQGKIAKKKMELTTELKTLLHERVLLIEEIQKAKKKVKYL